MPTPKSTQYVDAHTEINNKTLTSENRKWNTSYIALNRTINLFKDILNFSM